MTSSLTTLGNFAAYWWYQSLSGTFGVAHVPGHGAGSRLQGRNTL